MKKRSMKKILAACTAACLVMTSVPGAAFAEEQGTFDSAGSGLKITGVVTAEEEGSANRDKYGVTLSGEGTSEEPYAVTIAETVQMTGDRTVKAVVSTNFNELIGENSEVGELIVTVLSDDEGEEGEAAGNGTDRRRNRRWKRFEHHGNG